MWYLRVLKGFILKTGEGPVGWKQLEKEGCFFICGVNNRVKMFSFNSFGQFFYRQEKGIPLFHISPFRVPIFP